MLYELEQGEFHRVLPLFRGCLQDPMMHAVIEGRFKGRVFVDDAAGPGAALVSTGAECAYVVGGQGSSQFNESLRQLVLEEIIPAARAGGRAFLSLFSYPNTYAEELESLFGDQVPLRTPLSTFSFDQDRFRARHGALPEQPVGTAMLKELSKELLSRPENAYLAGEIASYWGTIDTFAQEGTGFCAVEGEDLVSWCYVQAHGHGAQTIDIWTAPGYRRQGLGTRVAAAVISKSLSEGYDPFWICDKANVGSRRLAERLGFSYTGDISLVDIPFDPYAFYRDLAVGFFIPNGEYRQAAESYERAFRIQQGGAQDCYHAAVAWASAGEGDRALEHLRIALESGWTDMERIASEPAFDVLPRDKWQALVND